MVDAQPILLAGALLALSVWMSLVARRLRVPGLVLFLALGMVVGPHGLDLVHAVTPEFGQTVGVIALGLILFDGGLASGWSAIRPVLRPAIALALAGTIITAAITGFGAAWLIGLNTKEGLLLGSIVAATDGAAVFALLRRSQLRRRLARMLEAEAGLNDPVAVLLVIGFIEFIKHPGYGVGDMVWLFTHEVAVGTAVGLAVGYVGARLVRRVGAVSGGLYPVGSVATAAVAFGLGQVLEGSGFLSVYLAGLTFGDAAMPSKRTITEFHDGLAWVSQIAVFTVLGLLVIPSAFGSLWKDSLVVTLLLMFVARPVAVNVSTALSGFAWREQVLLGWAGLRGAVPIVMATFPVTEGVTGSNEVFNLVFFVVITSALIQGTSFEWAANRLGLTTDAPALEPPLMQVGNIRKLGAEVLEYPVRDGDAAVGRVINELGLPRDALVNVIVRGDEALLPRGSTEVEAGDRLHILVRGHAAKRVEALFERWRDGPLGDNFGPYAAPITGRPPIFSVRPWRAEDGDPGEPQTILRLAVRRRLRTRRDEPGALVVLEDGRFAVTGVDVVAVGGPNHLLGYCSRRIRNAQTRQARAWWQEIAGAVAHSSVTV